MVTFLSRQHKLLLGNEILRWRLVSTQMDTRKSVRINDLSRIDEIESSQIVAAFTEILDSGTFLNGLRVKELERSVELWLEGRSVAALANGTDALYVALRAVGIGIGSEVATVGNAAGYATSSILRCGARPLLIEVDRETTQLSAAHLESRLKSSPGITAVVVTHLYGLMADVPRISQICRENSVLLIEDCAQAFGASHHGVPAGAWGDAAAFSFYPTKNLAALGDGGLVAFKKLEDAIRAKKIAQYGWSTRYEVELLGGINSRLDEIQAAVVLHRLTSVDAKNARRREILGRYARSVVAPRRFIFEDSSRCVAHLGVMRTPSRESDEARLRDAGIETSIHYPIPDHHQPAWRHLFEGVELPNTEAHCREVLTLPCFPELTEDEITRVCQALREL